MAQKLCVVTSYTPNFAPLGDICADTLRIYAQRHGCDSHVCTNAIVPEGRPPAWHRVRLIPELFDRGYEFVLWVDADALFARFDEDVLGEVRNGIDLCMVRHDTPWCRTALVPNTGVMLVRNCDWSRRLFKMIWDRSEYANHFWWENAALIDLMGFPSIFGTGTPDRPNEELLSRVRWLDDRWNFVPGVSTSPNPIIRHYGGKPFGERLAGMRQDFSDAISLN